MLQVRPITKKSGELLAFKELYLSAFPKSEQTPIWFLLHRAKRDSVKFYGYYDDDVFAGFSYTITQGELTCVQYLAVGAKNRSKGYGTLILSNIKEQYPDNRILLGIEAEDENAANNEQRRKRRTFYIKNEYFSTGIFSKMNGVIYEMLMYGGTCTTDECQALLKEYLGPIPYLIYKPKFFNKTKEGFLTV